MDLALQIADAMTVNPSGYAVFSDGEWHTWADVAAFCDRFAGLVESAGSTGGLRVAALLWNRPWHYASIAATLSLRHTLVTINPSTGDDALVAELHRVKPHVVVAARSDWGRQGVRDAVNDIAGVIAIELPEGGEPMPTRIAELGADGTIVPAEADPAVAIEMLTSGTTGRPKRIPLRYSDLGRSLADVQRHHGDSGRRRSDSRVHGTTLLCNPPVHMSGMYGSIRALTSGRSVVLLERFSVDAWSRAVVEHRPKVANLVPAAMRMVLDADVPADVFSSVRVVTTGSAPVPAELAEEFERRYSVPVLVSYGATEFAGAVAGWTMGTYQKYGAKKRGSVGVAHPGTELRIVDSASLEPLPPGKVGLLEVRSTQLNHGQEWVRTTDLATIDEDGFLWIKGRADGVIIRGGFKIWPAEVQRVLEGHPGVREAVVFGIKDSRLGQIPVAAVERSEFGAGLTPDALREYCRRELTAYQTPARIVILDALPRTASMKVAEAQLRQQLTEQND